MPPRQPPPEPLPNLGPILDDRTRRERFDAPELAVVLSHYDLGIIEQIRAYPRGSRRAPKVRITARGGEFLLKRRAPGRDDPYRVAFAHSLQLYLAEHGYPVPTLIGTREGNNSMLHLNGRIYELFEHTSGTRYDGSTRATELAGRALGALHRLLAGCRPPYEAPVGTYHAAAGIDAKLKQVPDAVLAREPEAKREALVPSSGLLRAAYEDAARRVGQAGFRNWPRGIIHGDWHPGNLLYRGRAGVVAVLDFDSARLEPRMADIANAALQFSMKLPAREDPRRWPDDLDVERVRRLVRGYNQAAAHPVGADELQAMPWLMIEALVLESVVPIAATGTFGRISGSTFLKVVERKVHWIAARADTIAQCLGPQG
ncbi:MAG: phosphotransferase enzyme family protein [Planctomycetota bacterium]|jgi:Ser/Thr protein kinase RdoA (MazF antagonist)